MNTAVVLRLFRDNQGWLRGSHTMIGERSHMGANINR